MDAQNNTVELKNTVIAFAVAFEKSLGTEKTLSFLKALTNFANTCPETITEVTELVEGNPQVFGNLLTPEGVLEAKQVIEQVATYMPLMSMFQQ